MSTSSVLHLHMQQWGKFEDMWTKTVLSLTSTSLWTLFCQTSVDLSQNVSSGCNCSAGSLRLQCKNGSPQTCRGDKGLGFTDPSRNQVWCTHALTVWRTMWRTMQGFYGQVLKGQQSSEGRQMSFLFTWVKWPWKVHSVFHSRQKWTNRVYVLLWSFLGSCLAFIFNWIQLHFLKGDL